MPEELPQPPTLPRSDEAPRLCFIIARPRSGTTVFGKMLRTHPKIVGMGEIFNESNPHSYFIFLQQLVREDPAAIFPSRSVKNFLQYIESCRAKALEMTPNCKALTLDVKYDQAHLLSEPWWRFGQLPKLFYLMREKRWKIIDIHRRDLFKLNISNQIAIRTNIYHSTALEGGQKQDAKVLIDPKQLIRDVEITKRAYASMQHHFAGRQFYKGIYYEDMFENQSGTKFSGPLLDQMSEFLGVRNVFEASPKLDKLLSNNVFDHVENADEIRRLVSEAQLGAA